MPQKPYFFGKNGINFKLKHRNTQKSAAWLAQLGECWSAEQEDAGSNPSRTNTQGLKITEEKVLPL